MDNTPDLILARALRKKLSKHVPSHILEAMLDSEICAKWRERELEKLKALNECKAKSQV